VRPKVIPDLGGGERGRRAPRRGLAPRRRPPWNARLPSPPALLPSGMLQGYAHVPRPCDHPQRTPAQSQGHHGRAAAARPDGRHRAIGIRQEHAGVRYAVRRGPAPLHRVALHLREAVPRADAQAVGGRDRGDLSRGRDRAEKPHHEQPVDGRHGHGDLRFFEAPLGSGRHPALRALRPRGAGGHRAGGRGHPARRRATGRGQPGSRGRDLPAARERAPARRRGRGAAAGGGLRARPARWSGDPARSARRGGAGAPSGRGARRGGPAPRGRAEPRTPHRRGRDRVRRRRRRGGRAPQWRPPPFFGASHLLRVRHGGAGAHAHPVLV